MCRGSCREQASPRCAGEICADRRQRDNARRAEQQVDAQKLFERLDAARDPGLGELLVVGGAAEMAVTRDGNEVSKLLDFHGTKPISRAENLILI